MPCCKKKDNYFSYTGSTYGGPVISRKYLNICKLEIIINHIFIYYDNKIEFRLANNIYFEDSIFDVYYLLSQRLRMKPELSFYIDVNSDFITNIRNKDNKRLLKKMLKNKTYVCSKTTSTDDYTSFHNILNKNLSIKHHSHSCHNLKEFLSLKNILKYNQALYIVKNNKDIIMGGVYVIKATLKCWYICYISQNNDIKGPNQSIVYIMHNIINDAKKENISYIDLGICTENAGEELNSGLANYKQNSLGGKSNSRFLFTL